MKEYIGASHFLQIRSGFDGSIDESGFALVLIRLIIR